MTESAAETNEALRSLAACYAAGVDRRQRDLFLSAFHPGATLAVHQPQAGPDGKPRLMRGHAEIGRVVELIARYPATFHLLGQGRYEVHSDRASGEVYTLEVCQTLWREQRAAYDSPELRFEAIHTMPKPLQPGGVPLWISGTVNPRVVNRLARFGTGWIPWGPAAADVAAGIRQMKDALADAGRDPGNLQVVGSLPLIRDDQRVLDVARTVEAVPRLAAAGVTDFRVVMPHPPPHSPFMADLDQLSALAEAFHEASS